MNMTLQTRFNDFRSQQPLIIRFLSRAAAFIIFSLVIYVWGYIPALKENSFSQMAGILTNTIHAANDGHPLMAYNSEHSDRLIKLTEISGGYYDMGWSTLISSAVGIGKTVYGPSYQADPSISYKVVIIFNLVTALLFLLPMTPFLVATGGLFALAMSIVGLPTLYNAFGQFWGATYTVIFISVLIATIGLKSEKSGRAVILYGVLAGIMIGIAQFIRNEATVTALVCTVVMLGGLWLLVLFYRRGLKQDERSWNSILRLARHGSLTLVLFIVLIYMMPFVVRGVYALTYQQPFADTQLAMHGDGHSLYISLGFVPNPYNIVWRDNVAMVHSEIIRPGVGVDSPYYMSTLRDEWTRIVISDPKLVITNAVAKVDRLIVLLSAMPLMNIFLIIFPFALVASCVVVFMRPTFQRMFIIISFLGLAGISVLVPLLIHPFYSQSFLGILLTTSSMLPVSLWLALRKKYNIVDVPMLVNRYVTNQTLRFIVMILGIGFLGVAAFVFIQSNKQMAIEKASLSSDPYEQIQTQEYRYDSIFNQLPVSDQENVISNLKSHKTSSVFLPYAKSDTVTVSFFRAEVLVFSKQQLHLISWLGVPDKSFNYNDLINASAFIRVCANCDPFPSELKNNPYELKESDIDTNILAINEADWVGHYRIITLPILEQIPSNPQWCAALQNITALDENSYNYTLGTLTKTCFQQNS